MLSPEQMAIREINEICEALQRKQDEKRIKAGVPSDEYLHKLRHCTDTMYDAINYVIFASDFYDEDDEDAEESDREDYFSAMDSFKRNLAELNELWAKYDEECGK